MLHEAAQWLYDPSRLTPHGFCLLWDPGLIWLHAVSDGATGFAYFTIPLMMGVLARRRPDLMFTPLFTLFATFILLCGLGHWFDLLTLWVPAYGAEGSVKAATAIVSVMTAISAWVFLPRALLLPSPMQLREVRDALSERERQSVALSRLNSDLEQFAYIASHDLKAPLHAIGQLADWIGEDLAETADPDTLEKLHIVRQRSDRLQMLIASLLAYSRAGHTNTMVETVRTRELVEEIVESIAPPPGFTVRFQGEAPIILTQGTPLAHVLRNLLSNAINHHDRSGGEITVSADASDGVVTFRIEDDGPGIAPKFHDRIFQIFQTLQSRDDRDTSGVGLSLVKKLVEAAGGTVWVESAPPRRGSAFLFTWPEVAVT